MFRHAVRTLFALAVAMAPALAHAALYRWVDELGVTHYATDLDAIPSDARDDALEIVASPPPATSTRAVPVPPAPPAPPEVVAPPAPIAPAPELAPAAAPPTPAPTEPAPAEVAPPEPAPAERAPAEPAPAVEPSSESAAPAPTPDVSAAPALPAGDPRAAEVAELEAKIAADREQLRQMISTKRWDSAELASDPNIREIAERLPRLQAELAALRAETVQ